MEKNQAKFRYLLIYEDMKSKIESGEYAAGTKLKTEKEYQELYQALDRLSDSERASLLLYYMQGYDVREIAETLGMGESNVRQHMSRGRKHLAQFMEPR